MQNATEANPAHLKPHQLYPAGRDLRPEFLIGARRPLMSRQTPIASIGSCFAREIKIWLVAKGYNYLQTARGSDGPQSPAAWNRVYNTFSMRQEFERALTTFQPRESVWEVDGKLLDPYRRFVEWQSREQAQEELEQHRLAAREAFTRAEVLIMTIGLREVWYSKQDGAVFAHVPPRAIFDPELHGFRSTTVEENIRNLDAVHALLAAHNPGCKILITVSPVPLRATFLDQNVLISNAISKATLVVATHEFVSRHPNTFYFPGYELVTVGIRKPLERDNRHVRRRAVRQIMNVFEQMYVAQ